MRRLLKYSFGTLIFGTAAIGGLGGLNLYTYHRFTEETVVASLALDAIGERRYTVTLTPVGQPSRQFELQGDEWQLDVRMIKWSNWLTFLGESPLYRLDRLSGRYVSIEDAQSKGLTIHALVDDVGIDVWAFARRSGSWLPGVDAAYGSSVFLPMADGIVYDVFMAHSGLLARKRETGGLE